MFYVSKSSPQRLNGSPAYAFCVSKFDERLLNAKCIRLHSCVFCEGVYRGGQAAWRFSVRENLPGELIFGNGNERTSLTKIYFSERCIQMTQNVSQVEQRLKELGIELPKTPKPVAAYVPAKTFGNLVYTSGQDCRIDGVLKYTGKVGKDLTLEQGIDAARQVAINLIGVLKDHIGDLDRVKQVVKMLAFVNSADGFTDQPYVINGASELLIQAFGEAGKHARSAISANELPFDTPVEIELLVELKPE